MNHWGTKTFPLMPGGGHQRFIERDDVINDLTKNPKKVYDVLGIDIKDIIDDEQILKYIT